MADALLVLDDLIVAAPHADRDIGASDMARRIRQWFVEARDHRLWRDYCREADEDEGYYTGVDKDGKPYGAWSINGSTEEARTLAEAGRPVLTLRHIKPQVDVLVGTERQNLMDVKALPQGDEDEDDARLMTQLLKWVSDQKEANETLSVGFKDGIIRGMYAVDVGLDWRSNPLTGDVYLRLLKPGKNVIWDPYWERHDFGLQTARYVLEYEWVWKADILARCPDKAEEIENALRRLGDSWMAEPGRTTDGGRDAYGDVQSHPLEPVRPEEAFYDPAMGRVLVITAWWRTWEYSWIVADRATGKIHDFKSGSDAREFVRSDPAHLTAVERAKTRIRKATVLPATLTEIEPEDDSPYTNDREHYPIVAYLADWMGDVVEGLVRALKDPTRIENKRASQAAELAQKYASMRQKVEEGALLNPEALNDPSDHSVIVVRPGRMQGLGWHTPQGLAESVRVLEGLQETMKGTLREIGPNTELLGLKGDAVSGIAMARRQMAGQTIRIPYFDNHRRTRKLVFVRMARRVQQSFTMERTERLVGALGEPITVRINPAEFRRDGYDKDALKRLRAEMATDPMKPRVLRDVEGLKFDIVISEQPATPTARAALVEQLVNVVAQFPAFFPLVADVLFNLLPDLPDRPILLERIKAWQVTQGVGQATPAMPGMPLRQPPLPPGMQPGEPGVTATPMPQVPSVPGIPPGALGPMGQVA